VSVQPCLAPGPPCLCRLADPPCSSGAQTELDLLCRALGDIGNTLSSTFNTGCNVGKAGAGRKVSFAGQQGGGDCSALCRKPRRRPCSSGWDRFR